MRIAATLIQGAGTALLLAGPGFGQESSFPVRAAGPDVLAALEAHQATVQSLELPLQSAGAFAFPLWIDGEIHAVSVAPHSVRAPGYRLMVGDPVSGYTQHPSVVQPTFRGTVDGFPESAVALALHQGQVEGLVRLAPGLPLLGFQPVSDLGIEAPLAEHVVYDSADLLAQDVTCGVSDLDPRDLAPTGGEVSPADGGPTTRICEVAIDSDVQYFNACDSSVTEVEVDVTGVINAVDLIYDAEVEIQYQITVIYVETAEPDPYTSSTPGTLLDQFQSHWNISHQGDPRDVAHLFTGRDLSGTTIGIAKTNTICNKSSAYGLSQSKYTSSFTKRTGLTAHELGHNWSSLHCDGDGDCAVMCSSIGGCTGGLDTFGAYATGKIVSKKGAVSCLSTPVPPVVFSANPSTIDAFQGGSVVLSGFNMQDTTLVHLGGTTLTAPFGFTIDSPTQISFHAPKASALGTVSLQVESGAGLSTPINVTFVETDPPKLGVPPSAFTGFAFNWEFAGGVGDFWYLFATVGDSSTVPFGGFDILANGQLLFTGTLDATGFGSAGILVPPGASGAAVFSQVLTLDAATLGFAGASNVAVSTILF